VIIASGANSVSVPVTLIVATHPLIQLSNTALTFSGQFAATTPPPTHSVQVTASDSSAGIPLFRVDGGRDVADRQHNRHELRELR
jgi:hypothetical protein